MIYILVSDDFYGFLMLRIMPKSPFVIPILLQSPSYKRAAVFILRQPTLIPLYMEEITITHDNMPMVLGMIMKKLDRSEQKLNQSQDRPQETADEWMNLKQLCAYLPSHPAEQTVYGWTSTRTIPYHKNGKHIVFSKSEVDDWIRQGKRKSESDLEAEAMAFINSKKKARP